MTGRPSLPPGEGRPVATRRKYTRRQKATAVMAAAMSSVEAAARETGIPRKTIAYWLDQPEYAEIRQKTRDDMAEEMRVLARLAAEALAEKVRTGQVEPRDLVTMLGVAVDKSQLLSGAATTRTETRDLTAAFDDHEWDAIKGLLREAANAGA